MRQLSARDARRAQDFQALARVQQRWLPLVLRLLRAVRRKILDDTKVKVWRSRMSPKWDARRRLRDLLWRAWVVPHGGGSSATRELSLRDMCMRVRFHDECSRMRQHLAQAMQAQEEILMTCPEPYRPPALRRGADEAGLKTPPSRAAKGKQSRGRGRDA